MGRTRKSRYSKSRHSSDAAKIEAAREARREKRQKQAEIIAQNRRAEDKKNRKKERIKRARAQSRRRRLILTGAILLIAVAIGCTVLRIMSLQAEKNGLLLHQQELLEQKARLEGEIANVSTDEYVEQQARTHLRMIKPGEVLYILPEIQGNDTSSVWINPFADTVDSDAAGSTEDNAAYSDADGEAL